MKHQRKDYARIQEPDELLDLLKRSKPLIDDHTEDYTNPEKEALKEEINQAIEKYDKMLELRDNPVEEDEPVILFRAKDKLMPEVIDTYKRLLNQNMSDETMISACDALMRDVEDWQSKNPTKLPDQPNLFDEA